MNKDLMIQYKLLYETKPNYGASSQKIFDQVLSIIKKNKPNSILDYGCGRSHLCEMIFEATRIEYYKYDPVFEEYKILPNKKVDFVICTDVLQHIPEEELDENMKEIVGAGKISLYKIKCTDHPTKFSNGKPTNCTIHTKEWWGEYLSKFYQTVQEISCEDETSVIYIAKNGDRI